MDKILKLAEEFESKAAENLSLQERLERHIKANNSSFNAMYSLIKTLERKVEVLQKEIKTLKR